MASRASGSVVKMKKCDLQQANGAPGALFSKISQLKKEIQTSRYYSVKEKLRRNSTIVNISTFHLGELSKSKEVTDQDRMTNMLSFRTVNPLSKISGYTHGAEEKDVNILEITPSTTSKLPLVEKIPPYTTWIFLDKNQRMAEDQSVVGRRQIYYDQDGGETLISSDSEEEIAEPEELKREFSEGEDQLLWKALQEYGSEEEVLNMLSQFVEATSSEILDRYTILMDRYQGKHAQSVEPSAENLSTCFERSLFLDKSLNVALDSFDTLFCRRCLVFDCRLHGCSQPIITPGEKQQYRCELVENKIACSDHCYLRKRRTFTDVCGSNDTHTICTIERDKTLLSSRNEEQSPDHLNQGIILDKTGNDGRSADMSFGVSIIPNVSLRSHSDDQLSSTRSSPANSGKRKVLKHVSITVQSPKIGPYDCQGSSSKKQKTVSGSDVIYVSVDGKPESSVISKVDIRIPGSGELDGNTRETSHGKQFIEHRNHGSVARDIGHDNVELDINTGTEVLVPSMEHSASFQGQDHASQGCAWGAFEKELYLKGIEIFGENSCLISRNLLSGLKTCIEVYTYMLKDGYALASSTFPSSSMEHNGKAEADNKQEMPARSRIFRRRGKARKLKYTWKTGAHPSAHKRIAGSKNIWNKQYTPCDCKSMCGKECPCTKNETCCEKYCGCSKNCKYRFRGCHCAKSQCRSRQCPCFAADRECDPDVCRNCWVSCGDGSIDVPPAKGDDYKCENMKLLLKQQQRILLGKSDVAGWGAFLKNPVNKNDYLGEYTGEIISHKEADKRGKIYDRSNSSYLFDLNDQGVLDAYRKGDKLKFANHSAKPNCFAKVKMVAGDHRVGIYALENIEAGEELFYDYCYAPDTHYVWARKAESSKKDESAGPSRRARKHQSMLLG